MQLVPEPIFTVTTDGIAITTIANTSSGRIFLGGRNGSLYEIYYQVNFLLPPSFTEYILILIKNLSIHRQRAVGLESAAKKLITQKVLFLS